MFVFSAPGESPPPPQRNTHGIGSDIDRIHRDAAKTQMAVDDIREMLKGYQLQSVSVTRTLSLAEYTLTIP